jgi:two-component system sensor histidine kinase UhpB
MLASAAQAHTKLARCVARAENIRSGSRLLEELENQRTRFAQELHAGAGQPLAGLRLNLELLSPWAETAPDQLKVVLARLTTLTDAALEQVRSLAHRFHPPSWQQVDLVTALRTLLENSGLELRFQETAIAISPLSHEPSLAARIALYRCAQECIANAIRHSEATCFSLSLRETPPWLQLTISDNGRGLPPAADRAGGIGLRAIREHVEAAGGDYRIVTAMPPGSGARGTTIVVKVPSEA